MHQASQQKTEESVAIKKVQKDAAKELESLKLREEQEKRALEAQLRNLEIENAFKQDLEISIQRAAQAVTEVIGGSRGTPLSSKSTSSPRLGTPQNEHSRADAHSSEATNRSSAKPNDGDGEMSLALAQQQQQQAALSVAQAALEEMQGQLSSARREASSALSQLSEERRQVADLRDRLAEEASLRKDLEVELEIFMARAASTIANRNVVVDSAAQAAAAAVASPANRPADGDSAAEARLAAELRAANSDLQSRLEKAQREASSLRREAALTASLQRENSQLRLAVRELRKDMPRRTDGTSRAVAVAAAATDLEPRSPFPSRYQRMRRPFLLYSLCPRP
jgi:hypothetical protein